VTCDPFLKISGRRPIFGTGEARHRNFGVQIDQGKSRRSNYTHDRLSLSPNGACPRSRDLQILANKRLSCKRYKTDT